MMGAVIDALAASPAADNTFILFTSDHGEMHLEHRHVEKMTHYEVITCSYRQTHSLQYGHSAQTLMCSEAHDAIPSPKAFASPPQRHRYT